MNKYSKERFLAACGGSAPIKVLLENRETESQTVYLFNQPNILLGQNAGADIRLRHPAVGNRHLYLQLLDGYLFAMSLDKKAEPGSRPTAGWIAETDIFYFGPYSLRCLEGFRAPPASGARLPNPLSSSPNCVPPIALEYRGEKTPPFRGTINRPLTLVGKSAYCKFQINAGSVSSIHSSLIRTSLGIWITDLSGREGIRLNGVSSQVALLEQGDSVQFGNLGFEVYYARPFKPALDEIEFASLATPSEHSDPLSKDETIVPLRPTPQQSQLAATDETSRLPLMLHEQSHRSEGVGAAATASLVPAEPRSEAIVLSLAAPRGAEDRESFERMLGPVLDHFAAFQNQTFQQFQDLLGNVMQMFGGMFQSQQEFVREEMKRFDRLTDELVRLQETLKSNSDPTAVAEAIPIEIPEVTGLQAPPPEPRVAIGDPVTQPEMHIWLQSRIAELHEQRKTLWSRLTSLLHGSADPK